jgi:prepilin-type N-terminal cleavage/methylation domain-containing protein
MRANRSLASRRRAFTLVEILVALVLVAAILPVVTHGISLALNVGTFARRQAEAATLARGKLDELLVTAPGQTGAFNGDFGSDQPDYKWSAQIQDWDGSGVRQVDVSVTWRQRQRDQSVTLSTLTYSTGTQ